MRTSYPANESGEEEIFCGEYSDRNNRCGGYKEYMEDYRLARGYEWRNGKLQEKIDPRCLNYHGIPTNNYNLPAVPGMNMRPFNARIATNNRNADHLSIIVEKKGNTVAGGGNQLAFEKVNFLEGVIEKKILGGSLGINRSGNIKINSTAYYLISVYAKNQDINNFFNLYSGGIKIDIVNFNGSKSPFLENLYCKQQIINVAIPIVGGSEIQLGIFNDISEQYNIKLIASIAKV